MSFPLFLALKYLKPKRSVTSVVTIFSIVGVLLGVAIMIIVRAVMTGFGDLWLEKILAFKPHVEIQANTCATGTRVITRENELRRKIEAVPGVAAVSPAVTTRVLVEYNGGVLAPVVIGYDPETATNMIPFAAGSIAGAFDLEGDSVMVGSVFAKMLNIRVGAQILVYSPMNLVTNRNEIYFAEELTVTGIFATGQTQFDSDFILVSLPLARDLAGLERGAYSIHVKTDDPRDEKRFRRTCAEIENAVGLQRYDLSTWHEADREFFTAIAVEKNMMSLLLAFITIVAIFCVTNTVIVTTVQKTNEIGLLKSLGFSSGQICLTFVLYGFVQCMVGILLGVGAAFLVLTNLNNILEFLRHFNPNIFSPAVYGLDELPWRISFAEVCQVALIVLGCCELVAAIFAWRAARLDPIEALRKE